MWEHLDRHPKLNIRGLSLSPLQLPLKKLWCCEPSSGPEIHVDEPVPLVGAEKHIKVLYCFSSKTIGGRCVAVTEGTLRCLGYRNLGSGISLGNALYLPKGVLYLLGTLTLLI